MLFADYEKAYALFDGITFEKNYAFKGGLFYVSYKSTVEVSASTVTSSYSVEGGVAYVNNNGILKINKGTHVTNNLAINSCFVFMINS